MYQHGTLFLSGLTALKIKTRDTVILPATPDTLHRVRLGDGSKCEREHFWKSDVQPRGEIKIRLLN